MHTRRAGQVVAPPLNCGVMRRRDAHRAFARGGIVLPLLILGCAGTSPYGDVAGDLFKSRGEEVFGFETVWHPLRADLEAASIADQRRFFEEDLAGCVERLEREAKVLVGDRRVAASTATVQLAGCLRARGWELEVQGWSAIEYE